MNIPNIPNLGLLIRYPSNRNSIISYISIITVKSRKIIKIYSIDIHFLGNQDENTKKIEDAYNKFSSLSIIRFIYNSRRLSCLESSLNFINPIDVIELLNIRYNKLSFCVFTSKCRYIKFGI